MSKEDRNYKILFIFGLAAGVIFFAAGPLIVEGICRLGTGHCAIYEAFGIYCPACGGTRALMAFLDGALVKSFLYHPIIVVGFAIYLAFMVSFLVSLLSKGKVPFYRVGYRTLLVLLIVILLQWAVKVFLQLNYGYVIP